MGSFREKHSSLKHPSILLRTGAVQGEKVSHHPMLSLYYGNDTKPKESKDRRTGSKSFEIVT
jgi:hypothetical protein